MPSPSSEDRPVIKSRTGKFLQGMFGKDESEPAGEELTNPNSTPAEFLQMVPDPITWDDSEESNWDDDFIEAPSPFAVATPPATPPMQPSIPEEPQDSSQLMAETLRELNAPANLPPPPAPPAPVQEVAVPRPPAPPVEFKQPEPVVAPATPVVPEAKEPARADASGTIAVNIPRPKNIKYKNQPPESSNSRTDTPVARGKSEPIGGDDQVIELNIKRPTSIKYKTKAPEPVGPIAKLQATVHKVLGRGGRAPAEDKAPNPTPATLVDSKAPNGIRANAQANTTDKPKGGFKLPAFQWPSLAMANRQQIVTIAAAVFLALTAAWATINFWPHSPAVAQAPLVTQPQVNPETELVQAVQSKLQGLASKYPAGLISNLELHPERQLAKVVVSNQWFNLPLAQRQQTAQSLWLQAVDYKMVKLEVQSMDGQLLARSPVVGGEAIVLDNF